MVICIAIVGSRRCSANWLRPSANCSQTIKNTFARMFDMNMVKWVHTITALWPGAGSDS